MASYQDTVLADSPVLFWRLDMIGPATNGDTIPDTSGNGRTGTLVFAPTPFSGGAPPTIQPYGYVSPIETDAASREFFGYSNPSFPDTGTSQVTRPGESAMSPAGNAACEAWIRPQSGMYGGVLIPLVGTSDIGVGWGYDGSERLCAYLVDSAGTTYQALDTSFAFNPDYIGQSFHCVAVRVGNSLLLYVNGSLRASTPISSLLPTRTANGDFFVGHNSSLHFHMARYDEVALYDHALTSTNVLDHYEAAKAILPLRATITVRVGLELNTDQITPSNLGFAHNFSETFGQSQIPIVEELSWKTNVNQSEPDYQQRVNAQPHGAYRTLEYHLSPNSGAARSRLQGALWTPGQMYCLPVWTDSGVTTGSASSGTDTIPVDTTKRDYEVGSYCGTCTDIQNPATYQFFQILAVADDELTLTSLVDTTIPSGSTVFPARLASISDDSLAVKSFAADHEDSILRFQVLESELSTRRITAYSPATSYLSTEVFSLESAKVSFLDDRPFDISRRIEARGRDYQYAMDTGSPQTFPVRFLLTTLAARSEFYGWLDARQGKQNPVWVSTKERDLIVTARPSATTLTVTKTGFPFHHGRRHIEFLKTDGSFSRLRVTAVADNGSTETWTFAATLPLLADISKASFLKYCVLGQDSVQIRHFKGGANGAIVSESSLSFRELLTSPA